MSGVFAVPACDACGRALWPPRPVCPRCGGTAFTDVPAGEGVIEEATQTAQAALASIRLAAGPVVIARLESPAGPGEAVTLRSEALAEGRRVVAVARER